MSYTKQTWATGDTVTATKLNHMEDGIAGAGGYDAVIRMDVVSGDITATIISGTYASLSSMIANDNVPYILVKIAEDATYYSNSIQTMVSIENSDVHVQVMANGDTISADWTSSDTITAAFE